MIVLPAICKLRIENKQMTLSYSILQNILVTPVGKWERFLALIVKGLFKEEN
jgi:lambda repressor-like predicted transcriptional regulator